MSPRRVAPTKKSRRISLKGIGVVLVLVLAAVLLGFMLVSEYSLATNPYQSIARRSLEKLCATYECPGQNYVESALTRIVFADRAEYERESAKDSLSVDKNGEQSLAFTTKSEPRKIFVNTENVKDLSREGIPFEDALEEILDHEVIHQAAVSQVLSPTLTLTFNKVPFEAISTTGLSLESAEGKLKDNLTNEAFTQWLASLQNRTRKVFYGVPHYDIGPSLVEDLNARVGLSRKKAFSIYVNEGLPGFVPFYTKIAGPAIVQIPKDKAGFFILIYLDRVLGELDRGEYGMTEAKERINDFISSGTAPPQK